jgi:hypothetical protein
VYTEEVVTTAPPGERDDDPCPSGRCGMVIYLYVGCLLVGYVVGSVVALRCVALRVERANCLIKWNESDVM